MDEKQIYQELMLAGCNIKSAIVYLSLKAEQMTRKYGKDSQTVKQFQQVVDNLESFERAHEKQNLEIRVLNMSNAKRKTKIQGLEYELKQKDQIIERLMKGI